VEAIRDSFGLVAAPTPMVWATNGSRILRLKSVVQICAKLRDFFNHSATTTDYFRGPPQRADIGSWLEVFPASTCSAIRGARRKADVRRVAQNAVGGRLGSLSEAMPATKPMAKHGASDTRLAAVNEAPQFQPSSSSNAEGRGSESIVITVGTK